MFVAVLAASGIAAAGCQLESQGRPDGSDRALEQAEAQDQDQAADQDVESQFQDVDLDGQEVSIIPEGTELSPYWAQLDGVLDVDPNGDTRGSVTVTLDDGTHVMLEFSGTEVVAYSTNGDVALDFMTSEPKAYGVDGRTVGLESVVAKFSESVRSGVRPAQMDPSSQALLAIAALGNSAEFGSNLQAARAADVPWYCALAAGTAAGLLFVAASAGCAALAAVCIAGGTITFGGITMACTPLITACQSGALASIPACYLFITTYAWG